MVSNHCPYCNGAILRHARQKGVYWFCMSCWQEVPLLASSTSRKENRGQLYAASQQAVRTSQM